LENVSQVILRNQARLPPGDLMLVNPEADELFRSLSADGREVQLSTGSHGIFRRLEGMGADVRFEAVPTAAKDTGCSVLILPREKERLDMLLQTAAATMSRTGRLWLVGENRAGIKSSPRLLERHFEQVEKLDSARHCSLFEARMPLNPKPFDLDRFAATWRLETAGADTRLVSLPGVFAHGRLDAGTALLLESMQSLRLSGNILDFASGCGVVGITALRICPDARLTLLDDSALAIEAGKRSLRANSLQAVSLASNGLAELDGRFDWILSNPPFHRGIRDDLDIAAEFFRRAGTFLKEKGRILVVFNRHLPYEGWLRDQFRNVNRLADTREFTVIEANKAK
jgi:16S rRNA (guanine1207-N2)-methyltransferase